MTQPAVVCNFEILAELGRGVGGIVYRAQHRRLKQYGHVALKVLFVDSTPRTIRRLARFTREFHALRILTTKPEPVIPMLREAGSDASEQTYYYMRELVEGISLDQAIANGTVGFREGIRVISTIASTVQRMHDRGIAHRNLRASKILVTKDGAAKMIGFGHVRGLVGARNLPPGMPTVSPVVDVLALVDMLNWVCAKLRQRVPVQIVTDSRPETGVTPGGFADSLDAFLGAS